MTRRSSRDDPIYDTSADIPFNGDPHEYLLAFCRCRLLMKIRQRDQSAKMSKIVANYYQKDIDKWQPCVEWLESVQNSPNAVTAFEKVNF